MHPHPYTPTNPFVNLINSNTKQKTLAEEDRIQQQARENGGCTAQGKRFEQAFHAQIHQCRELRVGIFLLTIIPLTYRYGQSSMHLTRI